MPQATLAKTLQQEAHATPIPRHIALMKCGLVDAAFDKEGWLFEPKLDGLRVICTFDGSEWTLLSRNDKPQNFQFPEIVAGLKRSVNKPAVLDGEIVCLDEHGRSSFRLLQQRFHLTTETLVKARIAKFPAEIFLFDILYFDKFDLRKLPLIERKKILKQAVKWKPPVRQTPVTLNKGIKLFEKAYHYAEEGIIAKRASSAYTGDRSGSWLKIKCSGRQEFVIGGYTDPQGTRIGFGALLVGYYDEQEKLHFAGKVGTGFDSKMLADLYKRLKAIEIGRNPFANGAGREPRAHFVEPKLVAEIEYSEWTQNHMLRQPRFQGLREDKDARSVRREKAAHVVGAPRIQHAADSDPTGNGKPRPRRLRLRGSSSSKSRASASAKPQAAMTNSV